MRSSRSLTCSGSEEARMSKRSCTAFDTLLTFWPPAPWARTAVSSISDSGTKMRGTTMPVTLLHVEELHLEDQGRVRRDDVARAARAVAELRRDGELPLAADLHALDALVPALDHVSLAEREDERIAAVLARIEFRSVGQPAGVMHAHLLAGGRGVSAADGEFLELQAAGGSSCRHGLCLFGYKRSF